MPSAVEHLAPSASQAAVLSLVAVADGSQWTTVCGSLLTVPLAVAYTSWDRWHQQQPDWESPHRPGDFDLGPTFWAEPFKGVRIARMIVEPGRWPAVIDALREGHIETPFARLAFRARGWSSTVFLGQGGVSDAHRVLRGARRPISGMIADLDAPEVPMTSDVWKWPLPPHLRPGPDLGAIAPYRRLLHWPQRLVGIDWLGHPDHPPEQAFVLGQIHSEAWIASTRLDHEHDQIIVSIGWDAELIDPIACALQLRAESDGHPILLRQVRITDLPSDDLQSPTAGPEPRDHPWNKRMLDVRLPRGPRYSNFGLELWSPDGRLLDDRPVARRFESFTLSFSVDGGTPHSTSTVGEKRPAPTAEERDDAVRAAIALEQQARQAAAARRVSTSGQLSNYLRWRFSCRTGELLIADPFVFGSDPEVALSFLEQLDRPIRALTGGIPNSAPSLLANTTKWLEVRALAEGRRALHDRVWIVGESGLLVGTSITGLVNGPSKSTQAASTITELPLADTAAWRQQFETWWSSGRPVRLQANRSSGS